MIIKKRVRTIVLLGFFFSAAIAASGDEISDTSVLVNTDIYPKLAASLFSPDVVRLAGPAISSPAQPSMAAPSSIPASARKELSLFIRGGKAENALFTTSLITMTALNVADYALTRQALKYPGLREGNPLMKPFTGNAALFMAVKAGTTLLSFYGLKKLFRRDKTAAWILAMTSNLVLSYVVANNMRQIQRARGR